MRPLARTLLIAGLVWGLDDEPNRAVLGRLAEDDPDGADATTNGHPAMV